MNGIATTVATGKQPHGKGPATKRKRRHLRAAIERQAKNGQ